MPFDANGPWYTSGLRLGTPALTTLGMGVDEVDEIADGRRGVLRATAPVSVNGKPSKAKYETEAKVVQEARARVAALCDKFPVYPEIDLSIVEPRLPEVDLAQQAPVIGSAVLPIREYLLAGLTAAVVTFLLVGPVRLLAVRLGAVAWPRGRDVHVHPHPPLGRAGDARRRARRASRWPTSCRRCAWRSTQLGRGARRAAGRRCCSWASACSTTATTSTRSPSSPARPPRRAC